MSNPCKNGATCQDQENAYKCVCGGGYTGVQCETGKAEQSCFVKVYFRC